MIGHFSAGQLASYRAGAVSDGRAARISSHLSNCPRCAQVDNDLTGVSQLLASVPIPAIPDHLTQRLQSALAAELAQRGGTLPATGLNPVSADGLPAAGGGASMHPPGWPGRPERARRRRGRQPRMAGWSSPLVLRGLAATGAVVLLVGGGLLLANAGGGRSASPSAAQGEPSGRGPRVSAPRSNASALAPPTTLHYQSDGKYANTNVVTTDLNYTKENLPANVRQEVASTSAIGHTPGPEINSRVHASNQLGQFDVARLGSCVSAVAAGRSVMLVEVARYMGVPAAIIVMRPGNGAFDVIVVGEACGASGQDVIARVVVPQH